MKLVYGEFCSRHIEAVSYFKELQQQNKRFQLFTKVRVKLLNDSISRVLMCYGCFWQHWISANLIFLVPQQQSSNSLVKRREIPECILLVTQRITKYPVLLERILHYTEGIFFSPTVLRVHTHKIKTKPTHILCVHICLDLLFVSESTEEHADLSRALVLIRELISAVDQRVSQYEQNQKLSEVLGRMENKCSTKLKSGYTFRKQDMTSGRALLHEGPLLWKTATGRLKGEKMNCVTLYFKVSLLQCNYTFKYWEIWINYMYLIYG